MAPPNQRLVNASKASPPSKASAAPAGESSASCRFNLKAFSRVFELVAMFLLICDVVLNHKHQILFATWAAGCLLAGVVVNLVSEKCIYTGGMPGDEEHAAAANNGWKSDAAALINIIALDGFLYEEEHYNHWGHTDNVLAEVPREEGRACSLVQ